MRTVIFEGISASGKTSTSTILNELSDPQRTRMLAERETVVPFLGRENDQAIVSHLGGLITKAARDRMDLVIADRFHLTHVVNAPGLRLEDFDAVEDTILSEGEVTTVYFERDETTILKSIEQALAWRGSVYRDRVFSTKGRDLGEIAETYASQQRTKRELVEASKLPFMRYDVTDRILPGDYRDIALDIAEKLQLDVVNR